MPPVEGVQLPIRFGEAMQLEIMILFIVSQTS